MERVRSDVHISRSVVFLCVPWRWDSVDQALAVPDDGTPFRIDDFRFCGCSQTRKMERFKPPPHLLNINWIFQSLLTAPFFRNLPLKL
jgi:hypothetical protein